MKIVLIIARLLLGIVFTVFGLNIFLHFIPQPPPQGQAGAFAGAMFISGYIYVIGALQVLGGLIMLSGRFVALGLVLLGPVIVNILLFHIFLAPQGLPVAFVVGVLGSLLVWGHWDRFKPIMTP